MIVLSKVKCIMCSGFLKLTSSFNTYIYITPHTKLSEKVKP